MLDRQGGLLRELHSTADGRGRPIKLDDLPDNVQNAFLAAEDGSFYRHPGIAPWAIARAAVQNIEAGRIVAGGSTITQQLARNLIPRPRTFSGKIQEALWALRLEAHLSKREILEQYLNRIPFGNNTWGLEAASELYFGRGAKNLSTAQAAMLASIPRGPSAYNPYRKPERLAERQLWVLQRMESIGALTSEERTSAKNDPIDLKAFNAAFRAPHFVEFIASHLKQWGLSDAVTIETTLDPALQSDVEDQIVEEISRLADRKVGSAAALVVDNATGEILAYQGSKNFFDSEIGGQNDGIQMKRQPGSALKPFVYAEAFTAGFTPASVLADLDTAFGAQKGSYAPKNYDRRLHGPVRAREALANSYNVPAVRLTEELGPARALAALRRAGFDSLDKPADFYGLGVVLGNGEVSIWEAARAFSGLSRGGVLIPLRPIKRALRADGTEIPLTPELKPHRFTEESAAALVTDILSDNAARARAFGLDNALRLPFPVAAKTGTSKGYSDNWTVGFTKERTVAVWAGNFDGTPMIQVSGITGAGPIFKRVMKKAMAGINGQPLVARGELEKVSICPLSGERAGPSCPAAMDEVFAPGTAPAHECSMHGHVATELPPELDKRCHELADGNGHITDLGLEYYDWARSEGLAKEPWLAAACTGRSATSTYASGFLSPQNGDEYLLFPDMPSADQTIPVRVRASAKDGPLELRMDGALVMVLEPPFTGRVPATKGDHVLTLIKPHDEKPFSEVRIRVRTERSSW
ncbi:MAG: penicillin-binding protein 1C [Myxococcaceae bacterium]